MNILVTGATGFIGRNFLSLLGATGKIYAVARSVPVLKLPYVEWIEADVSVSGWVERLPKSGIDAVVYLAQSKHYREFPGRAADIFAVNTRSPLELAAWALECKIKRFVFASTGNVYGPRERTHRETDACEPESMYGASKLAAEILLKPYASFFDTIVLRFFGVYGPGQANAMLPDIAGRFLRRDEITLAQNVGVSFNPIYVDDATRTILALVSEKSLKGFEILNVGGREIVDLKKVAEDLESISGIPANIRFTDAAPKFLVGSVDKVGEWVDVESFVSLREGLSRMLESMNKTAEHG